jgi:lipocalin-like protein
MIRYSVVLSIFAVLLVACSTGNGVPDTTTAESEPASASDGFAGTWRLVSWTSESEAGEKSYPWGGDAFGRIIYHPNGRMMVTLMQQDRPAISTDRTLEATAEDLRVMAEGFFAYSGTYVVDVAKQTVTHQIQACTSPNWVGTARVRQFERLGPDQIVLRPTEGTEGYELLWQREE